jgi:hypothetical protein
MKSCDMKLKPIDQHKLTCGRLRAHIVHAAAAAILVWRAATGNTNYAGLSFLGERQNFALC